jgi:hypothetical protein
MSPKAEWQKSGGLSDSTTNLRNAHLEHLGEVPDHQQARSIRSGMGRVLRVNPRPTVREYT